MVEKNNFTSFCGSITDDNVINAPGGVEARKGSPSDAACAIAGCITGFFECAAVVVHT